MWFVPTQLHCSWSSMDGQTQPAATPPPNQNFCKDAYMSYLIFFGVRWIDLAPCMARCRRQRCVQVGHVHCFFTCACDSQFTCSFIMIVEDRASVPPPWCQFADRWLTCLHMCVWDVLRCHLDRDHATNKKSKHPHVICCVRPPNFMCHCKCQFSWSCMCMICSPMYIPLWQLSLSRPSTCS